MAERHGVQVEAVAEDSGLTVGEFRRRTLAILLARGLTVDHARNLIEIGLKDALGDDYEPPTHWMPLPPGPTDEVCG